MKSKIPAITIGLDLGDKKHAICVLNSAGEIVEERSITNNREALKRLSLKYPKGRIAMEVGQHSPWTSRFFEALGHEVLVANAFILTIGDPQRFGFLRDVAPYLGLVPKRDQSGETDKQLGISKAGDAYLRRLLVSAAHYVLGPFGPDCDLKRHGLQLAARGGRAAKKKAVVAIARKLALLMLTLWYHEDMEARLPVSIRNHGPGRWQQHLGAAAPNPAKLSQLDRIWFSPLNPLRGLLPSRPPGEAGGILAALRELQLSIQFKPHPI